MNPATALAKSEAMARQVNDLLEQAPAGMLNSATADLVQAVNWLRLAVREQQNQIAALQTALNQQKAS